MDFYCLTRKELQFLCKRNKIPANMTNLAMADALKALEIVEGLDEFRSQSQSPEKTMNKASQEIPSTVTRTSTRRKTSKEENQSTRSAIRTRKTTRIVSETPVTASKTSRRIQKTEPEVNDQRKSDLVETPSQSCRGRPGLGSRRKVEPQKEGSVQPGYATRRSVRLLGKSLARLSLKESGKEEPVKVDEMVEGEVGNNNGQSGATTELPLVRNLSSSLEDERELNDDEVKSESNNGESDGTLISEIGSHIVSPNEKDDEPEGEDKSADDHDAIIDSMGSDDNAVSKDSYEMLNLNEEPVADETNDVVVSQEGIEIENLKEELVVDKSIEVLVAKSEDTYEEILDHFSSADTEAIDAVSVENADQAPQGIESQKLLGIDCEVNAARDDLTILPKALYADDQVSQNVSGLPESHMDFSAEKQNEEYESDDNESLGDSDIDDDAGSNSKSLADDDVENTFLRDSDINDVDSNPLADGLQEELSCEQKSLCIPTAAYSSEGPRTMVVEEDAGNEESDDGDDDDDDAYSSEGPRTMVVEEALVDDDEDDAGNEESDDGNDDDAFLGDDTGSNSKYLAKDPMANTVDEEALVDANVTEVGIIPMSSFHNTSQSVVDAGDSEAFINVCIKPAEEFEETASNSEIITTSVSSLSSPLKAQFSQPRKSSSKKQTTIPKVTQDLDNINKENIDNHSVKKELDPCLRKVKKNKNKETMQNLEGLSLRNLKKLVTEQLSKLEIKDDNLNKQQPFGKRRPALQALPQNSMNGEETEIQN